MLGILGGMGPLATLDFMAKVISATGAKRDQDHVPMLVFSVPQIPDRTEAILNHGLDPLPDLLRGIVTLERAGATMIAVACNTAHYWYPQMERFARVPMLNIVDACSRELAWALPRGSRVGLLATRGTVKAGIYQERLENFDMVVPEAEVLDIIMQGITNVKAGAVEAGHDLLEGAAETLLARGCQAVIMACTVIPVALSAEAVREPQKFIDPTSAMAKLCVERWHLALAETEQPGPRPPSYLKGLSSLETERFPY